MTPATPTLALERKLLREHAWLIACDEVGRGAIAGPVVVGATLFDAALARKRVPEGLRDSKLIAEHRRTDVAERTATWAAHNALGWATAREVDEVGIIRALGLAALRAITQLVGSELDPHEGIVLLDGNYDYISPAGGWDYTVRPVIKGDRDCASAAAASVIAKVARDAYMIRLHDDEPVYEWAHNKGYASAAHRDAISAHGMSEHHRQTWAFQGNTLF